jgi:pentatricopeptide repeat protein
MIRLLCNEGKWQKAEVMVDDMQCAGLRTSESICRALLDAKARLDGSADDSFT